MVQVRVRYCQRLSNDLRLKGTGLVCNPGGKIVCLTAVARNRCQPFNDQVYIWGGYIVIVRALVTPVENKATTRRHPMTFKGRSVTVYVIFLF